MIYTGCPIKLATPIFFLKNNVIKCSSVKCFFTTLHHMCDADTYTAEQIAGGTGEGYIGGAIPMYSVSKVPATSFSSLAMFYRSCFIFTLSTVASFSLTIACSLSSHLLFTCSISFLCHVLPLMLHLHPL